MALISFFQVHIEVNPSKNNELTYFGEFSLAVMKPEVSKQLNCCRIQRVWNFRVLKCRSVYILLNEFSLDM